MSKKGARSSGGTGARRRALDQARAANLKAAGEVRTSGRCAVCNAVMPLTKLPDHYRSHS